MGAGGGEPMRGAWRGDRYPISPTIIRRNLHLYRGDLEQFLGHVGFRSARGSWLRMEGSAPTGKASIGTSWRGGQTRRYSPCRDIVVAAEARPRTGTSRRRQRDEPCRCRGRGRGAIRRDGEGSCYLVRSGFSRSSAHWRGLSRMYWRMAVRSRSVRIT